MAITAVYKPIEVDDMAEINSYKIADINNIKNGELLMSNNAFFQYVETKGNSLKCILLSNKVDKYNYGDVVMINNPLTSIQIVQNYLEVL